LYSKKFKGEKHFAIEQPDGTYALLPAWLASPDAMKFTLKPKAYVSLESLLALQKFIKDYHKSSDVSPTLKSGGIYEKISAASNSATKFISRYRNSRSQISSRGKRKNNRAVKTVVNRHLQAKKKRRKK
jgi:hypothetical protein